MALKSLATGIGLATSALALGFAQAGVWAWTPPVVALAALWLYGLRRGWSWVASVGLVFYIGTAAGGLWLGVGAGWMLFGVVAAVAAWDLHHFVHRLWSVSWVDTLADQRREMERRHLGRLLTVSGSGGLLAAVALGLRVELSFGVSFLLGLLAVVGLSKAIGFLRRGSD